MPPKHKKAKRKVKGVIARNVCFPLHVHAYVEAMARRHARRTGAARPNFSATLCSLVLASRNSKK